MKNDFDEDVQEADEPVIEDEIELKRAKMEFTNDVENKAKAEYKYPIDYEEKKELEDAHAGSISSTEKILNRYKPLVRARAHAHKLAGADYEDLVQEGMIGLFKAIRDFKAEIGAPFSSFASLCVNRQILTAVKTAARKKHFPLNSYLSLNQSTGISNGEENSAKELKESEFREPEHMFINSEGVRNINSAVESSLSSFERQVIKLYLAGENYLDIALRLNREPKSIDNALQRIRRKIGAKLKL